MAAAPNNFHALLTTAAFWADPTPDYAQVTALVGDVATNRAAALRSLLNVAARSPTAVAMVLTGDEDHICVGHSPFQCPAQPGQATGMDDRAIVLVGCRSNACAPVALPNKAFERTNQTVCANIANIVGAQGFAAAPL